MLESFYLAFLKIRVRHRVIVGQAIMVCLAFANVARGQMNDGGRRLLQTASEAEFNVAELREARIRGFEQHVQPLLSKHCVAAASTTRPLSVVNSRRHQFLSLCILATGAVVELSLAQIQVCF